MANGTVTLQYALATFGIGPDDEVIVPGLTWIATAMTVHYVGTTPVFVDIERDTLCMDPEKVAAAITNRAKAIIPVHLYTSMADMEKIMHIADSHNLIVIEDCAHMHGGFWDGKGAGTIGYVGSFSFQQSKTMASGEGVHHQRSCDCRRSVSPEPYRIWFRRRTGAGNGYTEAGSGVS